MPLSENTSEPVNRLLAALPKEEYQRLAPHLQHVSLSLGEVLHDSGEAIAHVYFPLDAMVSYVALMEDGSTAEAGLIGREGMVGIAVILGDNCPVNRAVVQIEGSLLKMNAEVLKTEFNRGGELQKQLLLYMQALLAQVTQSAACNALHTLEQRFARWLLAAQDNTRKDVLPLTHEFIAKMLGTRRPGVTETARNLSQAGVIRYKRGKITILNREGLEATACECYGVVTAEFQRLFSIERG
ncbi:MAG: Crp/Fnr family transcriptional regulator [Cyanobacteriota bacterium]